MFEWRLHPGHTTAEHLTKVQEMCENENLRPDQFTGQIIFMSLYNDIDRAKKHNEIVCKQLVSHPMPFFPKDYGLFEDREIKENGVKSLTYTPDGKWKQYWCSGYDDHLHRTRPSSIQVFDAIIQRFFEKAQRRWKILFFISMRIRRQQIRC